ncbi:MAG: OmpA family protein [Urechidicola sp.]|nr:OmpA family protein [Urechidicola sp.]
MKHAIGLLLTFFLLSSSFTVAQKAKLNKANKKQDEFAYIDASKVYLKVAESGFKSVELFKKLGDSYYFNAKYKDAAIWYKELFILTGSVEPIYFLRYSQSLKASGKDEEASLWFNKYGVETNLTDSDFNSAEDYLKIINLNSNRYTIKPVSINSSGMEFGAGFKDTVANEYRSLVFAASRKDQNSIKRTRFNRWSGLPYLDLYQATLNETGLIGEPVKLDGNVNTKYDESSAIFTKDGKTMYFTRNNTTPINKKSKNETKHLKIYRAHLVNGEWINVEDLSINGDAYSTAHPALNNEENLLYFVSDMPETNGLSDIFKVFINSDGSLGKPVNLGEKINTTGRESFPFITKENELYFSSDGHFGLGGYDVFYIKIDDDDFSSSLINLGKPINSKADDFAFVIHNHKGFVSSNRSSGFGYDDIFSFVENKAINDFTKSKIFGVVRDRETRQPLLNARISLSNEDNIDLTFVLTDSIGYYQMEVEQSVSYLIKATKELYIGEDAFSMKSEKDREHNFDLSKNKVEIKEGDDIAKLLNVIIYFDFDKYNIRKDAEVELQKIIAVLKQDPTIELDIRSHTDSRGNDSYNMSLSQRRNNATLQYIINGGIDESRLTGRGYGESQLINTCVNGTECSKELHQANRRSEFIVK